MSSRRYLFTAYSELQLVDFEHFDKVCDRIFILVPEAVESIPLPLVKRLQKLGRGVKWVEISDSEKSGPTIQLAFLLGRLHQKLPGDIEFAILSDDPALDPLVQFILEKERRCLRIRVSQAKTEMPVVDPKSNGNGKSGHGLETFPWAQPPQPQAVAVTQASKVNQISIEKSDTPEVKFSFSDAVPDEATVRSTAREIIEKLTRSGNRPAEVATLKQYISLFQNPAFPGFAEKVVTFMALNNDIQILEKEVVYNF